MRRSEIVGLMAVAALLLAAPEAADAQCAMCRTALGEGGLLAAAFRHAILFLLVIPFGFAGVVAMLIVRERKRRLDSNRAGVSCE